MGDESNSTRRNEASSGDEILQALRQDCQKGRQAPSINILATRIDSKQGRAITYRLEVSDFEIQH